MQLSADERAAFERAAANPVARLERRCREWFDEQRTFWTCTDLLAAAQCGRRAGKTSGGCPAMLLDAMTTPGFRGLYINETRAECARLAWHGGSGDGMYSLVVSLGLPFVDNQTELTLRYIRDPLRPDLDSWIYLIGVDDEAAVRKALGMPWNRVWWDEAQKIPPKLSTSITETLMPSLLDRGGVLRLTGTPVRNMSGLFYEVTRPDSKLKRWRVDRWNLLSNPYFGRVVEHEGALYTVYQRPPKIHAGPFNTREEAEAHVRDCRHVHGILALQELFGGEEVAPLDGPLMQREGYGRWVHEDALYTYDVRQVAPHILFYAPHRTRQLVLRVPRQRGEEIDVQTVIIPRFPDIERAIADLPGRPDRDYFFAAAADIGFRDPFAWSLAAWSLLDPVLYEVATYRAPYHDQPEQVAILRHVQEAAGVSIFTADAGGSNLPTVKGWSEEWMARWGIAIDEVEKTNKAGAQASCNGDIRAGRYRMREGSPLFEEMSTVQYITAKTGSGKLVEDPSIPNDAADTGLYVHRRSYAHRFRPEAQKPQPGTPEFHAQQERIALEEAFEEAELRVLEPDRYW